MTTLIPEVGALLAGRYRVRGVASDGPGYLTLHAFDRDVEVEVSLLWFRPGLFPDKRARKAFIGDAVRTRGLAHPHLRRLYDAHIEGDSVFVAAQVGSAAPIIKRLDSARPTDELEIIRYATAIGQGLEVAHRIGTVHGYLVPTDIVEVSSQIKVSGVGLYAAASSDVARDLFWTRRKYIAPEVLRGELPTPASDVFSLAALLTELASGVSGVELSESVDALASQHIRLADIFARASRVDPADRTQTVGALLAEIRRDLVDDRVPTSERPAVGPPPEAVDLLVDQDSAPTLVKLGSRADSEEGTQVSTRRAESEDNTTVTRRRSELEPHPMSVIDASGDPLGVEPIVGDSDKTTEYRPVTPRDDHSDDDDDDLEPELIVVETPPPELLGGTVEVAFERNPKTIQGVAPPGTPAARSLPEPPHEDEDPEPRPRFVSRKPPEEPNSPRTPHLPVIDRPDGQVKVRPIPSRPPSVAPPLGNYAPPRSSSPPPKPKKGALLFFLWGFAGIVAVVLGALIAVVVVRGDRVQPAGVDAGPPSIDAALVIIDAAPPKPCRENMALMEKDDKRYCIDLYEAPGRGKMPATEVGHADAEARCAVRGARLCTSDEWEQACLGADDAPFPYGPRYDKGHCNGGRGIRAEVAAAGSFPECVSASGAFDMSGNVAEWTAEGFVQGGSARDRSSGRCSRRFRGSRKAEGYPDVGYRCCASPDPDALAPADPNR